MNKAILIFPAGMPRSVEYLAQCLGERRVVIGSSSLGHDPVREHYPAWLTLPYVNDDGFAEALRSAVYDLNIGGIFTPNPVVWGYLNRELATIAPGVVLLNPAPGNVELASYRAAQAQAQNFLQHPLQLSDESERVANMSESQIASIFRHVEHIPGMCDHEKTKALLAIARSCVVGDVVEIGSWWGKSAFILLTLARTYKIGRVLCVDPWSDGDLVQHDAKNLVDVTSAQFSAEEAFQVFLMNLLPYAAGDLNYIRATSALAVSRYSRFDPIVSSEFGTTNYEGKISLLHIDGNHSFENASMDLHDWAEHVVSGGWIVMDDYRWPYGDGPQRAADNYLKDHASGISCVFFMGGALFMRKC